MASSFPHTSNYHGNSLQELEQAKNNAEFLHDRLADRDKGGGRLHADCGSRSRGIRRVQSYFITITVSRARQGDSNHCLKTE